MRRALVAVVVVLVVAAAAFLVTGLLPKASDQRPGLTPAPASPRSLPPMDQLEQVDCRRASGHGQIFFESDGKCYKLISPSPSATQ